MAAQAHAARELQQFGICLLEGTFCSVPDGSGGYYGGRCTKVGKKLSCVS